MATDKEKIAELEKKVDRLYELVESVALNVVDHTTNIDRQINDKLKSLTRRGRTTNHQSTR
ncbi:hypothetical protein [Salinivibrio sp. VYel1]|uniref:hypothetical protein n=1 Tax=Salinivibrio sp. VYel1 TaxID=2490490 RepID=UPI00128B3A17|nr:hypothetical protein [Salinivibrio sp. VYel1]MPX91435.1 hypothetical protein [Salinivibrio sp. VYel1]